MHNLIITFRSASRCALTLVLVWLPALASAQLPLVQRDGGRVPSLAPIIREAAPAVVNIRVVSTAARRNPLVENPAMRRFFQLPPEIAQQQQSAGSGVIIDARRGFVVTNHHVVDKADRVLVILKDRRHFEAQLVGSDPGTDIALLRIEARGLSQLRLGDSDQLEVGDFTVAIGNPFGLGQTVTSGIVSALGRSGLSVEGYEDFIQTDASINPGNSGGALIDLNGRLVGVNSAIIAPSGANVGIGFAVPSNMVASIVEQLIDFGEIRRGRLGVVIQDVTPELAQALNLDSLHGAVISRIEPGSPANRAGLKTGDVIVSVDGRAVVGSSDLRNRIGLVRAGQAVELIVVRDGRRRTIKTRVETPTPDNRADADNGINTKLAGAAFRDLARGDPAYGRVEGVLVSRVASNSPAWRNGLRSGDIITSVNSMRVARLSELRDAINNGGRALALRVLRGRARLSIVIS